MCIRTDVRAHAQTYKLDDTITHDAHIQLNACDFYVDMNYMFLHNLRFN